jgi:hypothetical protein
MITHIIVTTYNRPEYYDQLVNALRSTRVNIHAWNDGSDLPYPRHDFVEVHNRGHHGKDAYGALVGHAFRHAATQPWDRLLMVPDDVIPRPDLIPRCESSWNAIIDPFKILLNPLVDGRGHIRQWGSTYPVKVAGMWLTGWNDLCFYTDERIRPHLRARFHAPPDGCMGSGVGSQWSRRVREFGNLWQTDATLLKHRDGPSVMCPEERELNPL